MKQLMYIISRYYFKDPELSSLFCIRYPNVKIVFSEVLNQLFRLAHLPWAYRLTTVGIETNNTCNLRCRHCPVNREMKRERGYIKFETFKRVIDLNPEVQRIYLTDWGEPLIHPQIIAMIRYAHSRGKQTALTTNGTTLDESFSLELLGSGLDIIKFSVDGGKKTFERLRGASYEKVESHILRFLQMRDELGKKIWVEVSMLVFEETLSEIDPFLNRWKDRVDYVNLQPKFFSLSKKNSAPCRDLWRILVVLWDGRVVPCCVDFEGELVIGDAHTENLQKLFNGQSMKELRKGHFRRKLPSLCQRCSNYYADYHISRNKLFDMQKMDL